MSKMLKDAAILFAITVIAGAVLGFVYDITKAPIAEQDAKAKAAACKEVFADAADFNLVSDDEAAMSEVAAAAGYNARINEVMEAVDASGNRLGYVLTVTSKEGFGGDIKFTVGVQNDGTVNGMSILSISETAGLGMKAGDVLVPQFRDKKVPMFSYTKTGATSDDQIDAISGATITTNAVVNAMNAGLNYVQTQLGGGAQ
ncbi:MAG: RnfABCDGE type electron transport complex subunit G [Lachnospiraceae bacterium]|nr:RnfABCDGE type electron transport complex subunit G [Lachnospiraceae bacterium]